MMNADALTALLERLFKGGALRRLPRNPEAAEAVMALALAGLNPDGYFDEAEINDHLSRWLDGISVSDSAADYVTVRRAMVDAGFLRRATDGVIYRVVGERIDTVLDASAKRVDPQVLLDAETTRREARQQAHRAEAEGL